MRTVNTDVVVILAGIFHDLVATQHLRDRSEWSLS